MNYYNKIIGNYERLPISMKATIWFAICNILQKGISMISIPIFTRILTIEQYGTYSVYLSWLSIISIFTSMNLYMGVFNKAMIKYSDDRDRYISSLQGLNITLCIMYFFIYYVFKKYFNKFFGLSTVIMCLMFIEMLVMPSLQYWLCKLRFEYRYRNVVLITLLKCILNPVLGVISIYISEFKVEARIFSIVIIEVIICGVIMIKQFKKGKVFFEYKYWKYSFLFNLPLIPHYLSSIILNQGDRIMIQKLVSSAAVALYSVAYNIGILMQLFTNAIVQSITPWLYTSLKNKEYKHISKRLNTLMIIVTYICFLFMLFAPEIVVIFASPEYKKAIYIIPPISASVIYIYIYNVYSNFEFYFEKKSFIVISSLISAVLNLVLNYLFIPRFGYIAAAYTTLICYVLYAYSHYYFSYKISIKNIENKNIFSFKFLYICSILIIFGVILSNILYRYNSLRYLVIIINFIILVIFRNKIFLLFKLNNK